MSDPDYNVVQWLFAGGGGAALLAFLRWVVNVWVGIRREELATAKDTASHQRADGARMVDALLMQAKSNAELAGVLGGKLDVFGERLGERLEHITRNLELFFDRERYTPVEGVPILERPISGETPSEQRRRLARERTQPRGYRPPRVGGHHDPNE